MGGSGGVLCMRDDPCDPSVLVGRLGNRSLRHDALRGKTPRRVLHYARTVIRISAGIRSLSRRVFNGGKRMIRTSSPEQKPPRTTLPVSQRQIPVFFFRILVMVFPSKTPVFLSAIAGTIRTHTSRTTRCSCNFCAFCWAAILHGQNPF
jgi:hypothetical protein